MSVSFPKIVKFSIIILSTILLSFYATSLLFSFWKTPQSSCLLTFWSPTGLASFLCFNICFVWLFFLLHLYSNSEILLLDLVCTEALNSVFFLILYITFFYSRYHPQTYSLLKFSFVSQSIFPILLNCLAIVCTVSYKVSFKKLLVSQAVFFLFFARVTSSFVLLHFCVETFRMQCSPARWSSARDSRWAMLPCLASVCSPWWLLFSHLKVPCTWLPRL